MEKIIPITKGKTIQVSSLIRANPLLQHENYSIFECRPATGIIYLANNFLTGHIRVRARNNGSYPYNYKEMIQNIFGAADNAIEVCSNSIKNCYNLTTFDIRPDVNPKYVADGQDMSEFFEDEKFDRWYCDPPYNEANALKMYDVRMPSRQKLLKEGARVIKKGSLMFFLLGAVNYQARPAEIERVGIIFITVVPNNEIRTLNIYHKKLIG
jgi:hypothetical protein